MVGDGARDFCGLNLPLVLACSGVGQKGEK